MSRRDIKIFTKANQALQTLKNTNHIKSIYIELKFF